MAGAQNAHWSYRLQNQNTYESSSAVTIIRSNGEAYIAHVEKDTNILRLAKSWSIEVKRPTVYQILLLQKNVDCI